MNTKWKLILFVALLLLVTSSVFLSACSALGGESTADVDSRITKLESELQANGLAIAKLQQQVDALVPTVAPTSPTTVPPVTPPASVPPTALPIYTPPATPPASVIPTALIKLDKLTITPTEVNPGQVVTVSIAVTNTGTTQGSYRVAMVEKAVPQVTTDVLEYADLITLTPGETKTVTFTTSRTVTGTYSVAFGTISGIYSVIAVPPPPPPSG